MNGITTRRIYEPPEKDDGIRILVDRIWPRGISKNDAHLALWLKDIAPSTELRQWLGHAPPKWAGFQKRYRAELDANPNTIKLLRGLCRKGRVTLLYAAHDAKHNHAHVLAEYLRRAE